MYNPGVMSKWRRRPKTSRDGTKSHPNSSHWRHIAIGSEESTVRHLGEKFPSKTEYLRRESHQRLNDDYSSFVGKRKAHAVDWAAY